MYRTLPHANGNAGVDVEKHVGGGTKLGTGVVGTGCNGGYLSGG